MRIDKQRHPRSCGVDIVLRTSRGRRTRSSARRAHGALLLVLEPENPHRCTRGHGHPTRCRRRFACSGPARGEFARALGSISSCSNSCWRYNSRLFSWYWTTRETCCAELVGIQQTGPARKAIARSGCRMPELEWRCVGAGSRRLALAPARCCRCSPQC